MSDKQNGGIPTIGQPTKKEYSIRNKSWTLTIDGESEKLFRIVQLQAANFINNVVIITKINMKTGVVTAFAYRYETRNGNPFKLVAVPFQNVYLTKDAYFADETMTMDVIRKQFPGVEELRHRVFEGDLTKPPAEELRRADKLGFIIHLDPLDPKNSKGGIFTNKGGFNVQ